MDHRKKCCMPSKKSCTNSIPCPCSPTESYPGSTENYFRSNKSQKEQCCCKNDCINLLQSIVPNSNFEFKILTNMTNTLTSGGNVQNVAVTQYVLDICNRDITFDNICCPSDDMNTIILGIPLIFLNKCFAYRVILPDISDATSFDYSDFVVVENTNQTPLPVDLQVANGYLNVIIVISGASVESDIGCQVSLTFTKFNIGLSKSLVFCTNNVICYPVTWKYGLAAANILPITTIPTTTTSPSTTTTLPNTTTLPTIITLPVTTTSLP